jgi:hypothetical protein
MNQIDEDFDQQLRSYRRINTTTVFIWDIAAEAVKATISFGSPPI